MSKDEFAYISPQDLRIGMFVSLDIGWMAHPFPAGSFKISSAKQIETLQGLGLGRVRYVPAKSDGLVAAPPPGPVGVPADAVAPSTPIAGPASANVPVEAEQGNLPVSDSARRAHCERRFAEVARQYRQIIANMQSQPISAAQQARAMINGLVAEVMVEGDVAVRLIKEGSADRLAMHPVNVAVLCMLLGKAMGMGEQALGELTLAAFLHDMGKESLPPRLQWESDGLTSAELTQHRNHVANGVRLGKDMGLSSEVLQAMQQHHELADGSGYPGNVKVEKITQSARILALVNYYDALCNPGQGAARLTPHEALARMFSQYKSRFDGALLSVFIRMMGVYPPGSVVQLADERYALVVSVNSSRPLKPRVVIFDPLVEARDAMVVDLEEMPGLGIRRSLKPSTLPDVVLAYLSPGERLAYYFEKSPQAHPPEALSPSI